MIAITTPKEHLDNGILPIKQLRNTLRNLNIIMSEEEIRDLELLVDPHSLGSFSDQKLVNALTNLMTKYDENEMQRSLHTLDRDQDGKISIEEFDYFMNEYGDKLQHYEKKILFQELIQPTDHLDQVKIDTLIYKIQNYR